MDFGQQYGSASRLQSVINMGMLSQYPGGSQRASCRRARQWATLRSTILAHETGHLFLAFASVERS